MEIKSFIKAIVQRSSYRGNEIRGLVAEEVSRFCPSKAIYNYP